MVASTTSGVLFVHSAPRALAPHIEWAVGSAVGAPVSLEWTNQPVLDGTLRAEYTWHGDAGTAALLASGLRGWEHLRFEVTEEPSPGADGMRYMHTPDLGVFAAVVDAVGNIVVPEDRVRYAVEVADGDAQEIGRELRLALGQAWDDELEPFRHAGDDARIVWLHRVG